MRRPATRASVKLLMPGGQEILSTNLMPVENKMSSQQGLSPEFALAYRQIMLDGLKNELETTKKVFAAIPDAKRDFRHDPNGRTAWELAWHIASSDVHLLDGIGNGVFERGGAPESEKPKTAAELVEWYDDHVNRAAAKVAALPPEKLIAPINFAGAFNLPAVMYLAFVNNHSVHHRGELVTYLRPMGSKVPSVYGGSFDEPRRAPERNPENPVAR